MIFTNTMGLPVDQSPRLTTHQVAQMLLDKPDHEVVEIKLKVTTKIEQTPQGTARNGSLQWAQWT